MKQMRLIYSDFVPNRPESMGLLELWCLLGGIVVVIFIVSDAETGFSGKPRLETLLSLVLPAFYFFINYLARYIRWMRVVLIFSISVGIAIGSYLLFFPEFTYRSLPNSDIALIIFSLVALFLVPKKRLTD